MPERSLPSHPNLEQYKNQAKDLLQGHTQGASSVFDRISRSHPRLANQPLEFIRSARFLLSDAQLVIAREHGFASWPQFAKHIEGLRLAREVAVLADPVASFIEAACVPREAHASGTLQEAEMIRSRYTQVESASIYTAAILGDDSWIRKWLDMNSDLAVAKGGPRDWDALTYLCFSRYLRLDRSRSEAFVRSARLLLDAGASANTGWIETIDYPKPRPIMETAIYGAAGIAQHAELTRLLLERGADPNDEETPYHVIESRDNTVVKVLLESGKLNSVSLTTLLVRKCDWHDLEGVRLALEHGADPNLVTRWGFTALHQAIRRDNSLSIIECLLDHHADAALPDRDGNSPMVFAAHRGRGDVLELLEQRGIANSLSGGNSLLAACARDQKNAIRNLLAADTSLKSGLIAQGGTFLATFSGVGNLAGVRNLLDLGVPVNALYREGDGYFDIARDSTALHVAAWRAWPLVVEELILRGAHVNAVDARGRTPLQLAVKACVDSYWMDRRSPDSVRALLHAGASTAGIEVPTGYDAIDELILKKGT